MFVISLRAHISKVYKMTCMQYRSTDSSILFSRHFFKAFVMDNSKIEIQVHEGKLIGTTEKGVYGDYYVAFRGIPYAKPPVGELRFKDPVPAEPWSGSRDASKYGNSAVQINFLTRQFEGDEDCLYLNVFTPKIEPGKKRTVMVWIHGGAFSVGSGDALMCGPDYIVRKDVVLVTLNYRLGALGFLNLYDKVATGNQGIKDVILALKWVQKNISQFGGDPKNVTIFGESAGGAMVHCLTLTPLAKDLFHKAIVQSGVMRNPWAYTEQQSHSTNIGFRLAEKLGKATTDPKVVYEFLKTIDAKKLIETQEKYFSTEEETQQRSSLEKIGVRFTPTLDHESSNPVFPGDITKFMSRGVEVPLLIGFTSCEGSLFVYNNISGHITKEEIHKIDSDFKIAIHPNILSILPKISVTVEELRSLYFEDKAISEETMENYVNFLSDEFFCRGTMEVVDIQTKLNHNKATYLYKFSYNNEDSPMKKIFNVKFKGASHGEDLTYLFYSSMMKDLGVTAPAIDSQDGKMINHLTQMWTDFAKTGNPTPNTNSWLPVTGSQGKYNYLNIDENSQMNVFHKGEESWNWEEKKNKLRH
ncbi:para-nitrobenzyl esterase [Solenopsis invicta]|uniref:para-nitrobenzyl esterase n=1 Tax=Solenopsis invicta TaxID=13686 RepID=UPI00193CB47C|nr:para-nitrobenzyl esterase [Solenopsis invicta]